MSASTSDSDHASSEAVDTSPPEEVQTFRRSELESLALLVVGAAFLGTLLFGWFVGLVLAGLTGVGGRLAQRRRAEPLLPAHVRRLVWIPLLGFERAATLLDRIVGDSTLGDRTPRTVPDPVPRSPDRPPSSRAGLPAPEVQDQPVARPSLPSQSVRTVTSHPPTISTTMFQDRRITFEGRFLDYFLVMLGLWVLGFVTLGVAWVFALYWSRKYFFKNLRIGGRAVVFTGSFGEFFVKAFGLMVLSFITFGIASPYFGYWLFKYFAAHLELGQTDKERYAFTPDSASTSLGGVEELAPAQPASPVVAPSAPPVASAPPTAAPAASGDGSDGQRDDGSPRYQFGS